MWTTVTMDNGVLVVIGGGWNLPPGWPNFCSTWMEITGTEGALMLDDTHRDNWLNTTGTGPEFPMSSMPGEQVDHVFAGQMGPETIHFLEACILDRPVMVKPEHARMVMETYTAADLSAERASRSICRSEPDDRRGCRDGEEQNPHGHAAAMRTPAKDIGLAIIGGGRVGLFRGEVATRHPAVEMDRAWPRRTTTAPARSRPRSAPIS